MNILNRRQQNHVTVAAERIEQFDLLSARVVGEESKTLYCFDRLLMLF